MKKIIALLLAVMMLVSLVACVDPNTGNTTTTKKPDPSTSSQPTSSNKPADPNAAMTYAEYMAAEDGMVVTVEFFVQANQGCWFDNDVNSYVTTVYGQTTEGGYFAYEAKCTEDLGDKLVPGTKVRVVGEKGQFNGEIEVMNGTLEIIEGETWIAEPMDVTGLLGKDELADHMNKKVAFKNLTVVACNDNGDAFMYNWDGSGKEGNDLYFCVSAEGQTYTFCVESYLCGLGSDAYEAVRGLKVGDVIDLEGFLYWYNVAQPHVTSVKVKTAHDIYMETEDGMEVTVEFYVQATQGWWYNSKVESGVITVYGQTTEGGYFAYEAKCDEETGNKLVPGTKVRVTGEKGQFNGEIEVMNGTLEIIEGETWIAEPLDVTSLLGTEELEKHMNKKVCFKGMTVVACNDNGDAFMYNWDGSGKEGNDLYFCVSINGQTYTFCVESHLCGVGSEAYEAVRSLQVGDVIDLEGFLYWYNTAQPHITSVTKVAK